MLLKYCSIHNDITYQTTFVYFIWKEKHIRIWVIENHAICSVLLNHFSDVQCLSYASNPDFCIAMTVSVRDIWKMNVSNMYIDFVLQSTSFTSALKCAMVCWIFRPRHFTYNRLSYNRKYTKMFYDKKNPITIPNWHQSEKFINRWVIYH